MTTPTRRVRRLKEPRPVHVRTDASGNPVALSLRGPEAGGRSAAAISSPHTRDLPSPSHVMSTRPGAWTPVHLLRRPWRIDQLWWRPGGAVSRRYFRVAPEDGPPFTLYHDLLSDAWYRQEY